MYTFKDVSADTNREVIGMRTILRRGILLHETIGFSSLHYLQGGALSEGKKVSADYLISRTGDIYQITPPGYYAFHSGVARWQLYQESDRSINQGFVGVELENNPSMGERIPAPEYIALAWLIRQLCAVFEIDVRNIVGHYQVALPSGRKSDPVTLNWVMLTDELMSPSRESLQLHVSGKLS